MRLFTRKTTSFQLESLEHRRLLSALIVSSAAGSGSGSLRAQIAAAHSGDTISFAPSLAGQTITLTGGTIAIAKSLTIQGLGANQLTIMGYSGPRSFNITGSTNQVAIRDLTITGFAGFTGGAISNSAALTVSGCTLSGNSSVYYSPTNWEGGPGGAIYNTGTLIVNNSTLSGNRAEDGRGGIGGAGGAIFNTGTLTVSGSSFSNNTAGTGYYADGGGGAICNYAGTATISGCNLSGNTAYIGGGAISSIGGALTVSNCTIANNRVLGFSGYSYDEDGNVILVAGSSSVGGGLFVPGAGTLSIDHSTVAGNYAVGGYGDPGYEGRGYGGGISGGAVQLYDTIIADNNAEIGPDVDAGGSVTSLGHNLIGNASGVSGFVASDLLNVNPQLGPLQNNGGPTQTMALLAGSPAINAGDNANAGAYDQRGAGFPRIVGGTIDIGAFESSSVAGKTWIGPASGGNWSTAANWSPGGVPAASDVVTISGKSVTLGATSTVTSLTLTAGATLTLTANGNRVLRAASLSISGNSKLNLNDNNLLLDYTGPTSPLGTRNGSAYSGVAGMIQSGRTQNGTWNGPGIMTSMTNAAAGLTGLGVGEAKDLMGLREGETAVWDGQTIDATTVILKYTYAGDGNLDGVIDGGDYGLIDNNVQIPGAFGYFNGDFNYDGVVDGGDYGIIDNNIQAQGSAL